MLKDFIQSKNLIGRFALVKLWPHLKAGEDECLARLKIAANALDLECFVIHPDGRLYDDPTTIITKNDVDFVLHIHYDTPKLYDAFSIVALWNPTQFYHQWGYARTSRNLLSHDDFVSCSSDPADHHLGRLIRKSANHLPPLFNIYHSLSDIVFPPTLGDHKLFYAGINWDALAKGVSRHQELLKILDETGALRIYGPSLFQGVKVWAGFKSYVKEIPFDGISMVNEINKAGIALVLSSEAHKQSQLMSSRLFESIAAGALIICDENIFAKKFFGDALLYIDSRHPPEEIAATIFKHMDWAKNNPQAAMQMIAKAQQIFRDKFSLQKNLQDLYQGFPERKQKLSEKIYPQNNHPMKVSVNFLMPEYNAAVLESHIASIKAQDYTNFTPTLVIDEEKVKQYSQQIQIAIAKSPIPIKIFAINYFIFRAPHNKRRCRIGEIISQIIKNTSNDHEAIIFVAPNEKIFSNHIHILAGSLARNPSTACAATAVMLKNREVISGNHETIDFRQLNQLFPIGYGRFIFRLSTLENDIDLALPYLDRKTMAVLIGENTLCQEIPATLLINVDIPFPTDNWDEGQENELISSYCPTVFSVLSGHEIKLPHLSHPHINLRGADKYIKWIINQIHRLRKQGLVARLYVMKQKFKNLVALSMKT